ncbi:putative F-box/FBD/LRR-repeat protein At5g44950 [Miscanthus floridulus]|uniref:putative F-box/FBD/LRR-repeat protein At5g44950 n=1 Tax=Miscanthus floridulus TaxID=154761 RepID=UPI00345B07EC
MAMVSGAKRRRGLEGEEEEEDEERLDRISRLPDGVLGDIVALLPTNDGARTQVLSSRWRHIWRSAPLNIDLDINPDYPLGANNVTEIVISRILSSHQGPCRRFSIPEHYLHYRGLPVTSLDGWLESPALDRLQELEFHYGRPRLSKLALPLPPPPASVHRFSSTLRAVSFGGCGFTDGNNASGLHFPVLNQLSLSDVRFLESSLRALLSACPVLQSLLLMGSIGFPRVQIASQTLRSIGVRSSCGPMNLQLQHLIIEDAPCLERLLCFDCFCKGITISVISAPELLVLGPRSPRLQFGTTVFQGSGLVSLKMVMHSVKVLSLSEERLSLDVVIGYMKCFPYLERLYIQTKMAGEKNVWCRKYRNLIGTLDIRLKKIVLAGYRGNTSHVNFAKFFVLNARMLESMRLELCIAKPSPSNAWIDKQYRLLQTKNKASRDMQLDFASDYGLYLTYSFFRPEQVHDLSTADPFP